MSMCEPRPRLRRSPLSTSISLHRPPSSGSTPKQSVLVHAQLAVGPARAVPAPVAANQAPPRPGMATGSSPPYTRASSPAVTTVATLAATRAAAAQATPYPECTESPAAALCVGGMRTQAGGGAGPSCAAADAAGVEQGQPPIVLILVGAPGSGKSWFAGALRDRSTQSSWVRVNQVCSALTSSSPGPRCCRNKILT